MTAKPLIAAGLLMSLKNSTLTGEVVGLGEALGGHASVWP